MTIRSLILLTCLVIHVKNQATIDTMPTNQMMRSTISKTTFKSREDCWKIGGTVANRFLNLIDSTGSSVKIEKSSDKLWIYNFGSPFVTINFSYLKLSKPLNFNNEIFLRFEKDNIEVFQEWKNSWHHNVLCESVYDYRCLQTVILANSEDTERFVKMNCSYIHGDLIINRITSSKVLSKLKRLTVIHGRLIISGLTTTEGLSFTNLETIGDFVFHGTNPILQITDNQVNFVHFPKLKNIECNEKKRQSTSCVVIGENWTYPKKRVKNEVTSIQFGHRNLTFLDENKQKKFIKNMQNVTEKDLVENDIPYILVIISRDFADSLIAFLISLIHFILCIAVLAFALKFEKNSEKAFDYLSMDEGEKTEKKSGMDNPDQMKNVSKV